MQAFQLIQGIHKYRHTLRKLADSLVYGLTQVGLPGSYDSRLDDR
jgi:hypothetical protein